MWCVVWCVGLEEEIPERVKIKSWLGDDDWNPGTSLLPTQSPGQCGVFWCGVVWWDGGGDTGEGDDQVLDGR